MVTPLMLSDRIRTRSLENWLETPSGNLSDSLYRDILHRATFRLNTIGKGLVNVKPVEAAR